MEFNFKKSPERAQLHHDQLVVEVSKYDDEIKRLQGLRLEAMEELAEVKTVLANNGFKPIELTIPPMSSNGQRALQLGVSVEDTETETEKEKEKGQRYSKDWSMHQKVLWILGKHGPMSSAMICDKLDKQEPGINRKLISSIISQQKGKTIELIPVDGDKPKFGLLKK